MLVAGQDDGAGTPGDWRALANFRADLKRAGLPIDSDREGADAQHATPSGSAGHAENPPTAPPERKPFRVAFHGARCALSFTQAQFANLLGVSVASVYQYESGAQVPSDRTFERLCKAVPELRNSERRARRRTPPPYRAPQGAPSASPDKPIAHGPMVEAVRFLQYLRAVPGRDEVVARLRAADAQGMSLNDVLVALKLEF